MNQKSWTDQRIEIIIGSLLRAGVLLAATVVLIGGVLYLMRHGRETIHYTTFHGEPQGLKSIPTVVEGIASNHARAIIQFGLLLLIATPIARVLFSAFAFALEKDYLYVVITLIVLAVLLYSFLGSAG
jgi:uncharacterized membrane protein